MRFHHLYEWESQGQEQQGLLDDDNNYNKNKNNNKNNNNNLVYRYDWLIDEDTPTIQNKKPQAAREATSNDREAEKGKSHYSKRVRTHRMD